VAAEQAAAYGIADDERQNEARPATGWPAPGELSALRRKRDAAIELVAAGRHAPGARALRDAIGRLARRGAWIDAALGGATLAQALLRRGRTRDAQRCIEAAHAHALRGGDDGLALELAVLAGTAWIDLARLDEAESVLASASSVARVSADPLRRTAASLALARCLFWRGQYGGAEALLDRLPDVVSSAFRVRHAALTARIAAAQGDVPRAMRASGDALRHAEASRTPALHAAAAGAAAFVRLTIGDWPAAEREAATSLAAARAARHPLRALRAQLVGAELARRRGDTSWPGQIARLRRVAGAAPPVVRAQWDLMAALCGRSPRESADLVARHIAATGLAALRMYVAAAHEPAPLSTPASDPFVDEIIAIIRVCQSAAEDAELLAEVCTRVRRHLHAVTVAVVATAGGRNRILALDGPRLDTAIAERAVTANVPLAPHRCDDRVEAAAPVAYGAAPIGALCARWTLGSTYDTSRALSALSMTATAAAPIVAAAIAHADRASARAEAGIELLGVSQATIELRRAAERAAAAPFPVLIAGESGSGKELVARAIHRAGGRRHKPFCALNCAALPEDLVEAELFGHTRGAFTGAVGERVGVFEEAHGGTLFLDEVGELSLRAQAKVLRVVQEGELRRVGDTTSRRVDVRIVSATNRDLRREVDAGRFRLDLLYRLDVIHIAVPALRERADDVAVLVEHFWRDAASRVGSRATLHVATIAALARHHWPGNVRELQNVLAALAVRCPKRGVIGPTALPAAFQAAPVQETWRLDSARRSFEERFVRAALVRTGGHRGRAAAELGVTRQGLTKLMSRLGISLKYEV
jgi:DNA-binding NtrC family response regulator